MSLFSQNQSKGKMSVPNGVILALLVWIGASSLVIDAWSGIWSSDLSATAIYKRLNSSVVMIYALDSNGTRRALGSGFAVGDGKMIATNFHVISEADGLEITDGNGLALPFVSIVGYSRKFDLAVIAIARGLPSVHLNSRVPEVGAKLFAIGHPEGLEQSISEGILSGVREFSGFDVIQMTTAVSHGSSGGPVVNSSGDVIGVTCFGFNEGQNLNFAIPASRLEEVMGQSKTLSLADLHRSGDASRILGSRGLEIVSTEQTSPGFGMTKFTLTVANQTGSNVSSITFKVGVHENPNQAAIAALNDEKREILRGMLSEPGSFARSYKIDQEILRLTESGKSLALATPATSVETCEQQVSIPSRERRDVGFLFTKERNYHDLIVPLGGFLSASIEGYRVSDAGK